MYFIGIDISKYKHDCYIEDSNGVVIRDSFSFDNTKEGFEYFLSVVQSLDHSQEIKIGLEATGHYGANLISLLNDNHLTFMEANPLDVKNFIRFKSKRREKNDKIDAKYIAQYIASDSVDYKSYHLSSYHLIELKSLTRFRESLVKNRSLYLVKITNILDIMFPEFKDFFNNELTNTALFILKKFKKPSRIAKFTRDDMVLCHNHAKVTPASKFEELKQLAKNTIGRENDYNVFQLQISLDLYFKTDEHINEVECKIDEIISTFQSPIFTIKGIGKYTASAILSEFGNIDKFSSPNQMIAFAGLDCGHSQSGLSNKNGKMVKHGSPHLRYNLLLAIRPLKLHQPTFKQYYNKKLLEGKKRRIAESHTAKKLIRVLFYILKNNVPFDSNIIR